MITVIIDFETYFGTGCNIKDQKVTEYVRHPDFEVFSLAYRIVGKMETSNFITRDQIPHFFGCLAALEEPVCLVAHNMEFDGFVASEIYNYIPEFYVCTLTMARPWYAAHMPLDLDTLSEHLKLGRKVEGVLDNLRNVRYDDLTSEQWQQLGTYNVQDTNLCHDLFMILVERFVTSELQLMDLTFRMATQPMMVVDAELAQEIVDSEMLRKKEVAAAVGVEPIQLSSNKQFPELLKSLGYEVPMKRSPTNPEKEIPALSKQDLPFVNMRRHGSVELRKLILAREEIKSTIMVSRAKKFLNRAGKPVPIFLKSFGAHTFRYSGSDGFNPQNLPSRKKDMVKLRHCLRAPKGFMLIVADAAQAEARMLACIAEQEDLVDAFTNDRDVYSEFATDLYGFPVSKDTPEERFVGKTAILGLGYYCGAAKFQLMLEIGAMGPSVIISMEEATRIVATYRGKYTQITQFWKTLGNSILYLMDNHHSRDLCNGLLRVETGKIWMPNDLPLSYPGVGAAVNPNYSTPDYFYRPYDHKTKGPLRKKLHGGILAENIIQSLSRIAVAEQALEISKAMPVKLLVHDELVACVPESEAEDAKTFIEQEMRKAPSWLPNLPSRGEAHITPMYGKF